jgi:uncharacterized phage protein gp47/JayE
VATFVFEDPFDDTLEEIRKSLIDQVAVLWPDPDDRPDTREGSLLWTLLSPVAFEIQRFQGDLNLALELGFLQFTFGEFLDLKGIEFGLSRKQGSVAEGTLRYLGSNFVEAAPITVPAGSTVSNVVTDTEEEVFYFDTTELGTLIGIPTPMSTDESQRVSVDGASGVDRFTLNFDGKTTTPLYADATASTIAAALEFLAPTLTTPFTTYSLANDSGIANAGGAVITFDGGDVADRDMALLTGQPYQVNEEQVLFINPLPLAPLSTFELTFDGDETIALLDQNSTGTDVVNAINALSPTIANTYGLFSVSTTTPLAQVDAPGGVTIVFDGGGVEFQNVPALQITSVAPALSLTGSVTTTVNGEDSDAVVTIEEVVKGRGAKALVTTTNQNEKQQLVYTKPTAIVNNPSGPNAGLIRDGEVGSSNQIQRLAMPSTVLTSGSLTLSFNDGFGALTTSPIPYTANAAAIQSALTALANIGVGDVIVSMTGSLTLGGGSAIVDIEFQNNLRNTNFPLITVAQSTAFVPAITTPTVVQVQSASPDGQTEKQTLEFIDSLVSGYGPVPDAGVFDLTIQDNIGGSANPISNIPFDVTAGELEVLLENSPSYGRLAETFVIDAGITDDIFSVIETTMEGLAGVNPGDVEVTLGAGTESPSWITPSFDVEFKLGLGNRPIPLMAVVTNALSPTTTVTITRLVAGGGGFNEKQRIAISNPPGPISGTVSVKLYYPSVFGDNFTVSGGPFNSNPMVVEYTGKNRNIDFKPMVLSTSFDGSPNTGNYQLKFNGGSFSAAIAVGASTQAIESALNPLATVVAQGGATVRVANGIQTLTFASAFANPYIGSFKLDVDDGVNPISTTNAIPFNAAPVVVQNELDLIVGVGKTVVYTSTGILTLNQGATYTIHFLNSNIQLYRHLVPSAVALGVGNSVVVGPTLKDMGAAYEIEFGSVGAVVNGAFEYDETTLTLSPQPNTPVISSLVAGDISTNAKQLLSLSHPAGLFKLQWGNYTSMDPAPRTNITALISPHFDNAVSIDHKLEALEDAGINEFTVTGGPLYSSPVNVEFSGLTLSGTDWPMVLIDPLYTSITGGFLEAPTQTQVGFGGAGGTVTGTVQYVYTIVSNLGVQDGSDDIDYEEGFGETAPSPGSVPQVVSNKKVLVQIAPVPRADGLIAPRSVRVFRKLTTGFTSTPYRLIGTISEGSLTLVDLGDETPPPYMYIVDNVPLSLFNATEEVAPLNNTTGVLDVPAAAQEIGSAQNVDKRVLEALEDAITGIIKVTNPEPFGGGSDVESDDDYRARLIEFVQKDPGAGNIDDYISWAKEVAGVAGASCIPEWQEIYGPLEGPGTVKVIVSGEDVTIIPDSKVEEVRQFIAGSIAITDPDQENAPASIAVAGGNIEDGIYEYVYTFINVGKGETEPSAASRVVVGSGNNTVELHIEKGPGGLGVQNTIGRRVYRRKVDGAVTGESDSEKYSLVMELLENVSTVYSDSAAFLELPTWLGYPNGPYERRKAPRVNSTSLFDGEAPIGAHVTVESISEETIWVNATIYPTTAYSVDGSGGKQNLTTQLDTAIQDFFQSLPAGSDIQIVDIANIIHDHVGVHDFKDLKLFSPIFPLGTTSNISIGPGVSAQYSSAGIFSTWTSYPYDKT